jgi:hypothetical protein
MKNQQLQQGQRLPSGLLNVSPAKGAYAANLLLTLHERKAALHQGRRHGMIPSVGMTRHVTVRHRLIPFSRHRFSPPECICCLISSSGLAGSLASSLLEIVFQSSISKPKAGLPFPVGQRCFGVISTVRLKPPDLPVQ